MAYQEKQTKKSVVLLLSYALAAFGYSLPVLVPTILVHRDANYDLRVEFDKLY